jgi:hypothetical protein
MLYNCHVVPVLSFFLKDQPGETMYCSANQVFLVVQMMLVCVIRASFYYDLLSSKPQTFAL